MESGYKHDKVFLAILKEEGQELSFLDTVFGFMYRCTDFYKVKSKKDSRFGFDPGVSENIVLKIFHKWNSLAKQDKAFFLLPEGSDDSVTRSSREEPDHDHPQKVFQNAGESYNGAVREGFRWSQSVGDIDVSIEVPEYVKKGNQLRVAVTASSLEVAVMLPDSKEWKTLVRGELSWKTVKQDTLWSLLPGKFIQIHLEKSSERWWDSLFTDEPKIDVTHIDKSRPMDELSEEEQMKVIELMWRDDRKRRGLATSPQGTVQEVVKQVWNKEGSPFKPPYDPSSPRAPKED